MSSGKVSKKPSILIVDDEKNQRELLSKFFEKQGYKTFAASTATEAEEIFRKQGFDSAIIDLKLPDFDGIELLRRLRSIDPDLGAVILTAYGTISAAAEGIKSGAAEFMEKPVDLANLAKVIESIIEKRQIIAENKLLKEISSANIPADIVAESPQMKEILSIVARVAPTDATVLITGESGTGKELIARLIHQNSKRAQRTFVPINCAAIPETLIESELFGYEPGAFTGARKRQIGKLELADGGTIFLDEIGDLPLLVQAKILRFLEDGQFFRLGGTQPVKTDVRVISATNRDIKSMVSEGKFREDLYYRLNVIHIHIPPLRERKEDLVVLAEKYLKQFARKHGKPIKGFTPEAKDRILRYPWPGNIRELRNTIERAVILSRREFIQKELIPSPHYDYATTTYEGSELKTLAEVEREYIIKVLEYCNGNQSEAARILGLHRNTLRNKLKEYGLL